MLLRRCVDGFHYGDVAQACDAVGLRFAVFLNAFRKMFDLQAKFIDRLELFLEPLPRDFSEETAFLIIGKGRISEPCRQNE